MLWTQRWQPSCARATRRCAPAAVMALSRCLDVPHGTHQQRAWALQAFGNLLRRMLEASGRGMWDADPELLSKLKAMYGELDDELEGV